MTKRSYTPPTMHTIDESSDLAVSVLEAAVPEMTRRLIARVERLDQRIESLDAMTRHDLELIIDEQKRQAGVLDQISALLVESLTQRDGGGI